MRPANYSLFFSPTGNGVDGLFFFNPLDGSSLRLNLEILQPLYEASPFWIGMRGPFFNHGGYRLLDQGHPQDLCMTFSHAIPLHASPQYVTFIPSLFGPTRGWRKRGFFSIKRSQISLLPAYRGHLMLVTAHACAHLNTPFFW